MRVNNEEAPSRQGSQQYKDCLLWEAVLELLRSYEVHFVTDDGDFYKDKNRE